jgi:hypothetical protein
MVDPRTFAKGGIVGLSLQDRDGVFRPIGSGSPEMVMPRMPRSRKIEIVGTGKAHADVVAMIEDALRKMLPDLIMKTVLRFVILNMIRERANLPPLTPAQFGGSPDA